MAYIEKKYRVSIAMGIYNCAPTLAESIDSLISQSYKNWELIMCDDASTDDTLKIALEYEDKYDNIKVIRNETNLGLTATLNRCIENSCKGCEFIARHDGDDISFPDRFAVQVDFLDTHPEYAFVSTAMSCFDENGEWGEILKPERPDPKDFAYGSPFCHASVMMRKNELASVGNYTVNKYLRRGQDYYLWHKFYCKGFRGYNIQKPYYGMRDDLAATKRRKFKYRLYGAKVELEIMRNLKLSKWLYFRALRGIIIGLLPRPIYEYMHKKKLKPTSR